MQYTAADADTVVVLAWHTGRLDGTGLLPSRPVRLPLTGIDPASVYRHGEQRYSGSHLTAVGLPVQWTAEHDTELVVLQRV
ncbi:GH36 C-terminal domain-containing protein [Streptomyces sp. NPDC005181]|uniref:GH36 C-terminal domain-containing protein n=1 Tax=Streptomyces sp. NPDC005181 TaxID=3156869 RepID=UPI0033BB1421